MKYYCLLTHLLWFLSLDFIVVNAHSIDVIKDNRTIASETLIMSTYAADSTVERPLPQWVYDIHSLRKELFMQWVEPIIVWTLGPVEEEIKTKSLAVSAEHRNLGFLPSYVEDVSMFRESSMSFATLMMLGWYDRRVEARQTFNATVDQSEPSVST